MSLSLTAIAEAPLSAASSTTPNSEKKVPPRRQTTALRDTTAEPEAR